MARRSAWIAAFSAAIKKLRRSRYSKRAVSARALFQDPIEVKAPAPDLTPTPPRFTFGLSFEVRTFTGVYHTLEVTMQADEDRSKAEIIHELRQLRQAHEALKQTATAQAASFKHACQARSETEEALRLANLIIQRSPVILFRREAGEESRLVYVSENIRQVGYRAEDFINGRIEFKNIVHPDDSDRVGAEIRAYAEQDVEAYTQVYRVVDPSGQAHWVEDQTSVVRDEAGNKIFNQGILIDFTRRKLVEDALRESEEKFRRIVETAGEGFVLMDEDLTIIDVNDAYCRLLGYAREEILGKRPFDFASDAFGQFMLANRDTIMAKEYRSFEGTMVTKAGHQVPILIHGNTLRGDKGEVIGNMAFVTDLSEQKKALALAGEVQKSLLPHTKPLVSGFDVAGRNISCDEIGGDYYDFFWRREHPEAPFSIVVGDITGHGVDAALLMTSARAFLRMRAAQPGSLAEIITEMNRHLARDVLEMGRFMTLFFMIINPQQRSLEWVRAGHDPALLYDPELDRFEELKGSGMALGVDPEMRYGQYMKQGLVKGQIIAIGTDGIWEAFNPEGEMFGKARFREVVRRHAQASAANILSAVFDTLGQFTRGQKTADDVTLVVIKVEQ
jgi:phosphoserine phosphatase RsbU/P